MEVNDRLKTCTGCHENKSRDLFHNRKKSIDGKCHLCKSCTKLKAQMWYAANREKVRKQHTRYYNENKEQILEHKKVYNTENQEAIRTQKKQYREKNKEVLKEYYRKYATNNREKINTNSANWRKRNLFKDSFLRAEKRALKLNATPKWLSADQKQQVEYFYWLARDLKVTTGQEYHVDHIIPLKGKVVCGLHVPWNLQILPFDLNIKKGNKLNEFQEF